MISKLRVLFVKYYYVLFILVGLTQMLRIQGGWTILCYLSFLFALTSFRGIKFQACDGLVLFFIAYCIITYPLFGDYPADIYIASIRDQLFPMSFYFFARSKKTKDIDLFQKAITPFMAVYIIGFFLFFTSPGWYIDYRMGDRGYTNSVNSFFNLTRMSSFWSSSYCVGYSALFVVVYIINKSLFDNEKIKHFGLYLTIAFLSLFFAQQRISLGFAMLYLLLVVYISVKRGKIAPGKVILYTLASAAIIGVIAIIVTKYMDKYYLDYILQRFTSNDDGLVEDRVNLFKDYIPTISLLGDGFGKYSHNAMFHDLPSITDCEYIRTPNEIGLFGMGVFILIVVSSLIVNYKKGRKYSFESLIVLFFLIAMVGATPLEVSQQQPFVLWYCLGKMQNK